MKQFILLAIFVPKNKLTDIVIFLGEKYKIQQNKIFLFTIKNNDIEYLITFKYNKAINIPTTITKNKPIHIHSKATTLFSINGLNKYIESISDIEEGNIDYKNIIVNWNLLKNSFLIKKDENLLVNKIKKVDLNTLLLGAK